MRSLRRQWALMPLIVAALFGCHHESDSAGFKFAGKWNGSFFAGGQTGTLELNISPDGKYTGTMYNQTSKSNGATAGTVSEEGKLTGGYSYPNLQVDAVGSLSIAKNGHLVGTVKGSVAGKPRGDAALDLVKE